jgi:hypothetical protein
MFDGSYGIDYLEVILYACNNKNYMLSIVFDTSKSRCILPGNEHEIIIPRSYTRFDSQEVKIIKA